MGQMALPKLADLAVEFNGMTDDEVNENLKACGFKSRTVMRRKRHEGRGWKPNIRGYENDQALNEEIYIVIDKIYIIKNK